jgi:hypothetical protein
LIRVILIATALLLAACSLFGGPASADVEKVAREQMVAGLPPSLEAHAREALITAAARATVASSGPCNAANSPDGAYACTVQVTSTPPGSSAPITQQFVVVLKKEQSGWVSAS